MEKLIQDGICFATTGPFCLRINFIEHLLNIQILCGIRSIDIKVICIKLFVIVNDYKIICRGIVQIML